MAPFSVASETRFVYSESNGVKTYLGTVDPEWAAAQ